jgi:integrase
VSTPAPQPEVRHTAPWALTVAVQRGHVPRNVATLVDPPRQQQSNLATALDLDEARAVLEAA